MIAMRRGVMAAVCAVVCGCAASAAEAQTATGDGRFEVSGGVTWTSHLSLGSIGATETAASGGFTLFSTSTELAAAPGVEVRLGVRLTPVFEVEGSSSYSQPRLQSTISGDFESSTTITASEVVHQYTVDGALVANIARWRMGDRTMPFVLAGAGYIRDLHEGETLAVSGQRYFAGGGIKYLLVSRPHRLKGVGVRVDARALAQRKGVAFDGRLRVTPTLAASLFLRF